MKGFLGGFLNVIGIATLAFVMIGGLMGASEEYGGTLNLVNQTIENPAVREDVARMQLASTFLTPMINIGDHYVSVDAFTFLIVLLISMSVIWLISVLFKPGMLYIIPMFILAFLVVATLWQGIWLDEYLTAGQDLGVSREALLDNLTSSGDVLSVPLLLAINIIAGIFVFYKLYYILPGL